MIATGLVQISATGYAQLHPLSGTHAVQLTVVNQPVYVQLGHGVGGQLWDSESYRLPGVHVIPGAYDAIRVRSAASHAGVSPDLWPAYSVDAY